MTVDLVLTPLNPGLSFYLWHGLTVSTQIQRLLPGFRLALDLADAIKNFNNRTYISVTNLELNSFHLEVDVARLNVNPHKSIGIRWTWCDNDLVGGLLGHLVDQHSGGDIATEPK
ncbi:hypothetical protein PGTUg99_015932 [Puccinia graminis f. sp. tritici]|uniref:Uncharacterized protein n=1 Tax=Puccinia graminis f. sp. tritici TaxID=56615 RepID=A0A5B0SBC9_PUCGR|nr:hypothetical protein PGTUg99_015932 [Puccinia graminis f. sp. tritici]